MSTNHELATQLETKLKQVGDFSLDCLLVVEATESRLKVSTPTQHTRLRAQSKFGDRIAQIWGELTGHTVAVEVVLRDMTRRPPVADDGVLVDPKRAAFRRLFWNREESYRNRDVEAAKNRVTVPPATTRKPTSPGTKMAAQQTTQVTGSKPLNPQDQKLAEIIVTAVKKYYELEHDMHSAFKHKTSDKVMFAKLLIVWFMLRYFGKAKKEFICRYLSIEEEAIHRYNTRTSKEIEVNPSFYGDLVAIRNLLKVTIGTNPL